MKVFLLIIAACLLNIGTMGMSHNDEIVYTLPVVEQEAPTPRNDATHYNGLEGHWVEVCATAYSPEDPIDSVYRESKGEKWRWKTANGRTDVRHTPYGIAVPVKRADGKVRPQWSFGTRVVIPVGLGYLDRSRADDRVFTVDDTGDGKEYFATKNGKTHIDLRFKQHADAIRWAGPLGYRFIHVFVLKEK